jgi:hypothetical protein
MVSSSKSLLTKAPGSVASVVAAGAEVSDAAFVVPSVVSTVPPQPAIIPATITAASIKDRIFLIFR